MGRKVLDFVKKRESSIESKRRNFERLMFDNILGAYSVIDDKGSIYPITLMDISPTGCLFKIPLQYGSHRQFKKGDEITLRMYFTQKEYIPVIINIKYTQEFTDNDGLSYIRCGGRFDTSASSFQALSSFIEFLYKFAEHSAVDHGDSKVYFL